MKPIVQKPADNFFFYSNSHVLHNPNSTTDMSYLVPISVNGLNLAVAFPEFRLRLTGVLDLGFKH